MRHLAERFCTGYTSLVRVQWSSHRDLLTTLRTEAQLCVEYLGCSRIRVSEDGHPLHFIEMDCDEERGDFTSRL